ncbi:TPA: hypothetical protein QDZ58_000979 [Pluralibacter gergoviae]|nr:hypothetical protein [Pluralibacter gergoviae]
MVSNSDTTIRVSFILGGVVNYTNKFTFQFPNNYTNAKIQLTASSDGVVLGPDVVTGNTSLGTASAYWKNTYLANAPIIVSDAEYKDNIRRVIGDDEAEKLGSLLIFLHYSLSLTPRDYERGSALPPFARLAIKGVPRGRRAPAGKVCRVWYGFRRRMPARFTSGGIWRRCPTRCNRVLECFARSGYKNKAQPLPFGLNVFPVIEEGSSIVKPAPAGFCVNGYYCIRSRFFAE